MSSNPYKRLAERLDALPNGYPPTDDGAELRILEYLFSPEEAALTAQLRLTLETPKQLAARIGGDARALRTQLKGLAKRRLISFGRAEGGLGYAIMPFAVGFYETQVDSINVEFARLFEDYYQKAFSQALLFTPQIHRVVPIEQTIKTDMEVLPLESATDIVNRAKAWGVTDCICRKQQALLGQPCDHPLDVCMVLSETPGTFDGAPMITTLTHEGALDTLRRAADAGLVHSVSNNKQAKGGHLWYICNCCTCSCAVLRGMAELGMPNVVARSAFVNQVDEDLCIGCGTCVERCQFDALSVDGVAHVDPMRCVGCGVCVVTCPVDALSMVRRPEDEIAPPPTTEHDWMESRAVARGLDLNDVM